MFVADPSKWMCFKLLSPKARDEIVAIVTVCYFENIVLHDKIRKTEENIL